MAEHKTMGIIIASGHSEAMGELTARRTIASVPVGGRYRLIDFTLSNMVNSGIRDVGIITRSNYQSLMDHLGSGREWDLARKIGGMVLLPPFSRSGSGIYRGSLEAIAGVLPYIKSVNAKYVVISDTNVMANIDLRKIIDYHIQREADITCVYRHGPLHGDNRDIISFGLAGDGRITDTSIVPSGNGEANVFLNMMVMERQLLIKLVSEVSSHGGYSFSKDVLQDRVDRLRLYGYHQQEYAARIEDLPSYMAANMDLLDASVRAQLYPRERPIYTKIRDEVPAKYGLSAQVSNSLVADGCIIEGQVENSVIFRGVRIGRGAVIRNSIVMQGSVIGGNVSLDYIIADKNVTIRDGRKLAGYLTYPVYLPKDITI